MGGCDSSSWALTEDIPFGGYERNSKRIVNIVYRSRQKEQRDYEKRYGVSQEEVINSGIFLDRP